MRTSLQILSLLVLSSFFFAPTIKGNERQTQQEAAKRCEGCGTANDANAKFCTKCGKPLQPAQKVCPKCNASNAPDAKFCKECGNTLDGTPSVGKPPELPSKQPEASPKEPIKVTEQDFEPTKKELRDALARNDTAAIEKALEKLVQFNDKKAVIFLEDIIRSIQSVELYNTILSAMASFTSQEALEEEIAQFILRHKTESVAKDLMGMMLDRNRSPAMIYFLRKILKDGTNELKALGLQWLTELQDKGFLPESFSKETLVPDLIEELKKSSSQSAKYKEDTVQLLKNITGTNCDTPQAWKQWYDANKDGKWGGQVSQGKNGNQTGTVIDNMDKSRKTEVDKLRDAEQTPKEAIVVLTSGKCRGKDKDIDHTLDNIQKVLTDFGIPHIVVTKDEFEQDNFSMAGRMALVVNCMFCKRHCVCPDCTPGVAIGGMRAGQCVCSRHPPYHDPVALVLGDKGIAKINDFVTKGGYLFTEDWNLEEIIERAFPNTVQRLRGKSKEGYAFVDKPGPYKIFPKAGMTSHPYLQRIFAKPVEAQAPQQGGTGAIPPPQFEKIEHTWQVDQDSPIIQINDQVRDFVLPLLISPDFAKEYQEETVALTFAVGGNVKESDTKKMQGGRVLHVLSHFAHQQSQKDAFTIQNLLINFLIEAKQRWDLKHPPKKK